MNIDKIKHIIQQGEGLHVEFKKSQFELNKDVFDSVCGFLNRYGGHLLLGVNDNGEIEGVFEDCVSDVVKNLVVNANNPNKLHPPCYLSTEVVELEGKKIIYVYVPQSSQVHSVSGKIFDRNEDGDLDITKYADRVSQLYLRKQAAFIENKVFPYMTVADLDKATLDKVRILASNERADHPWQYMNDEELLSSAGLFKRDLQTGAEGYTLAAALLLGTEQTVLSVLPYFKTDALLRRENLDRYDDRDDIRSNLISSYERLIAFVQKHLPDKFYLEGIQRVSLRDRVFREVISNLLIHREFGHAYPAKLIIEKDRVVTENWNRAQGIGHIDPENFTPYPKNPVIANFFKEIGWVDELGSGVRNVYKYAPIYTPGTQPTFMEGDIFKTVIPLRAGESEKAGENVVENVVEDVVEDVVENEKKILTLLSNNNKYSASQIARLMELAPRTVQRYLKRLQEENKIERIGPAKGGHWKVRNSH